MIPTRDEERSVGDVIRRCLPHVDEVIVVDGHSHDRTREVAAEAGATVLLDRKRGKGDALRIGMEAASGEVLVFIDADGSHDPDDIPALVAPILAGESDLVVGSRMLGGSDELHGNLSRFVRMTGSAVITLGINYRFRVGLTDSQNGFRAIRADAARALGLREDITTIEQEMVIKALHQGLRLSEVPSHEWARLHGHSRIRLGRVWPRYGISWLRYLLFR